MNIPEPLSIADFKAEKRALERFIPEENIWKSLAIWINTFGGDNKRAFFDILVECHNEELLRG